MTKRINLLNREELAWAAGFFDGEGYIASHDNSRSASIVAICIVDAAPE